MQPQKPTKKDYENYLNRLPACEIGGRKYGTWVRRHDPIAFEIGYGDWCRNERKNDERSA